MKLSKTQYIQLADQFRDSAQDAHQNMRGWMNRALVAEASLAALRTAYEPPHNTARELTDANGNPEPELPTTIAESE